MTFHPGADPLPESPSDSETDSGWTAVLAENRQKLRSFVASKLQGQGESAIDDVLQEVALAAHGTAEDSIEPNRVLAWLRQVASHKIQDHWRAVGRQQKIRSELGDTQLELVKPTASPSEWVMRLEQRSLIAAALNSLESEEKAILEQKYLHGQTYEQIAHQLGLSIKTLEYRLSKAKQNLRRLLEKDETPDNEQ